MFWGGLFFVGFGFFLNKFKGQKSKLNTGFQSAAFRASIMNKPNFDQVTVCINGMNMMKQAIKCYV